MIPATELHRSSVVHKVYNKMNYITFLMVLFISTNKQTRKEKKRKKREEKRWFFDHVII